MKQPVTLHTKQAIVDEWFDLKRFERYYRLLKRRYRRYTIALQIAGALAAFLAVFPALALAQKFDELQDFLDIVEVAGIAILLALYFVDKISKLSTKYDLLDPVISGCSSLNAEIKELWDTIQTTEVSEQEASAWCTRLTRSVNMLLTIPDKFITEDDRLRDESSREALSELEYYIQRETT
ncbi:MAG: hypothetical protein F4X56_01880 [Gammaproteobacteria bacterium]|nr:hypothetical protein [Gammaproteobacteria bacterium]